MHDYKMILLQSNNMALTSEKPFSTTKMKKVNLILFYSLIKKMYLRTAKM